MTLELPIFILIKGQSGRIGVSLDFGTALRLAQWATPTPTPLHPTILIKTLLTTIINVLSKVINK
jgi:hypothetical protein